MSNSIEIFQIGKKYILNHQRQERYIALRDVITDKVKQFGSRLFRSSCSDHQSAGTTEEFWALQNVTFNVAEGERIGIIGRNGAGKSTLLKVLSRITEPTTGKVTIRGRVASLLEVGTGFHPELTGRENIFLNGAILGMTRTEIKKKFEEIVYFSEVERFLDTPVKRYSSGMYVRLAFSVAAHLESDILIVDEVLAVGDAAFQEKCLGKMKTVANSGRTVLFVSHNIQAIDRLCTRCVLLSKGQVAYDGKTRDAINHYAQLSRGDQRGIDLLKDANLRDGSGRVRFVDVEVANTSGKASGEFSMGDTIRFRCVYKIFDTMRGVKIFIAFRSGKGLEALTSVAHVMTTERLTAGTTGYATIDLPDISLRPGEYPVYLHISEAAASQPNFDVLDGVLPPLLICNSDTYNHYNYDPAEPAGYFSIHSRVIDNRLQDR